MRVILVCFLFALCCDASAVHLRTENMAVKSHMAVDPTKSKKGGDRRKTGSKPPTPVQQDTPKADPKVEEPQSVEPKKAEPSVVEEQAQAQGTMPVTTKAQQEEDAPVQEEDVPEQEEDSEQVEASQEQVEPTQGKAPKKQSESKGKGKPKEQDKVAKEQDKPASQGGSTSQQQNTQRVVPDSTQQVNAMIAAMKAVNQKQTEILEQQKQQTEQEMKKLNAMEQAAKDQAAATKTLNDQMKQMQNQMQIQMAMGMMQPAMDQGMSPTGSGDPQTPQTPAKSPEEQKKDECDALAKRLKEAKTGDEKKDIKKQRDDKKCAGCLLNVSWTSLLAVFAAWWMMH